MILKVHKIWLVCGACDGGFQDETVDQNGEPSALRSRDNVHVDGLQLFSSLLWLLPRRFDDRDKLNATFSLFDFLA